MLRNHAHNLTRLVNRCGLALQSWVSSSHLHMGMNTGLLCIAEEACAVYMQAWTRACFVYSRGSTCRLHVGMDTGSCMHACRQDHACSGVQSWCHCDLGVSMVLAAFEYGQREGSMGALCLPSHLSKAAALLSFPPFSCCSTQGTLQPHRCTMKLHVQRAAKKAHNSPSLLTLCTSMAIVKHGYSKAWL